MATQDTLSGTGSRPHTAGNGARASLDAAAAAAADAADGAAETLRAGGEQIARELPAIADTAVSRAGSAMRTIEGMDDPALYMLGAGSAGLAAGLFLMAAPRILTVAALFPALAALFAVANGRGRDRRFMN